MRIANKAEMYALYERGAFGNMLRSWRSVDAYASDDYSGLVNLRYAVAGSRWCRYGMTRGELLAQSDAWVAEGASRERFKVNELARDAHLLLQGEVMRGAGGLSLRYSTIPKPMRVALAECECYAQGLRALLLLRSVLDPASDDDLHALLDIYDGAVVEFSTWDHDVGNVPRRNTVFWEVRHY